MGRGGRAPEKRRDRVARFHRSGSGADPAGRGLTRLRTHGTLTFEPGTLDLERPEPVPSPLQDGKKKRRRIEWGAVVAWLIGVGTFALVAILGYRFLRVEVTQEDLQDGAVLGSEEVAELEVRIELASSEDAEAADLSFDDEEIEDPDIDGSVITWVPPDELADGEYELRVAVPRLVLGPAEFVWRFELDTVPPEVEVATLADRAAMDQPVSVEGTAEPDAELSATTGELTSADDGAFHLDLNRPPAGPVILTAVDGAGNETTTEVIVPVRYPTTRSVFVSASGWSDPGLRSGVLALADQGRIDAVHLELKDAEGIVGFDTTVDQAHDIGAVSQQYRLDDAVEALRDRDVRVIGRMTAFHDPVYARHAWSAGAQDQVVQSSPGEPYGSPANRANLAHPDVQDYNLDIALDAVDRGVDEIVWEGVRPPGDEGEDVVVPGLEDPAVEASSGFLARAHAELRRRGAYQGMASLGLVVQQTGPSEDLAKMARHVDYVVPIIEPQYWSAGSFDVANPASQPGELVAAYLAELQELIEASGADVVPHLQDFGYNDDQVQAQVSAARSAGVESFLLYSPNTSYTAAALEVD